MSDTSGRVNFGAVKKVINTRIRPFVPIKGKKKTAIGDGRAAKPAPGQVPEVPDPKHVVWEPLAETKLLKKAFLESELLLYLRRLAEFIEKSALDGVERVCDEFNVQEQSALVTLQRTIRASVPSEESTDFQGLAQRSFHVASNRLAKRMTGIADPTRFKIGVVVKSISSRVDDALVLAGHLVLEDYGERLLRSALPGGATASKFVTSMIEKYRGQVDAFMKAHQSAEHWTSKALAETVHEFSETLVR